MRRFVIVLLGLILLGHTGATALSPQQAAPAAAASPRDEALRNFDDAAGKLLRLAEAIPADKYTWRPGEGVRSVSEVFLHVSAGNFNIPRRLGTNPPEGLDIRGLERSTTDKAKVIETMKQATENVRAAFAKVDDLEKTTQWFGGRQATMREIMFFIASHNHEHLGQSIAYARVNGVVPPWTEERQQQQPAKQPAKPPTN
jgi:uncharacterized damage-inducible protein DinB